MALAMLKHVAAEHPAIRRGGLSARPIPSLEANGVCHAVLTKPWRRDALERALIGRTNSRV